MSLPQPDDFQPELDLNAYIEHIEDNPVQEANIILAAGANAVPGALEEWEAFITGPIWTYLQGWLRATSVNAQTHLEQGEGSPLLRAQGAKATIRAVLSEVENVVITKRLAAQQETSPNV